jgi:hypothetical protein
MSTTTTATAHPTASAPLTGLDKLAKEVHGSPGKLLAALATQERWHWADVALLIVGDRKALAEQLKKLEEETEKAQAQRAEAQIKADAAMREGAERKAQAAAHP